MLLPPEAVSDCPLPQELICCHLDRIQTLLSGGISARVRGTPEPSNLQMLIFYAVSHTEDAEEDQTLENLPDCPQMSPIRPLSFGVDGEGYL
jgi:hypothetical protein